MSGRIAIEVASDTRCPLLKMPLSAQMPLVLKSWEQVKAAYPVNQTVLRIQLSTAIQVEYIESNLKRFSLQCVQIAGAGTIHDRRNHFALPDYRKNRARRNGSGLQRAPYTAEP
jgi:hypothetical protein